MVLDFYRPVPDIVPASFIRETVSEKPPPPIRRFHFGVKGIRFRSAPANFSWTFLAHLLLLASQQRLSQSLNALAIPGVVSVLEQVGHNNFTFRELPSNSQ
jgi:hypothetical protein